MGGMHDTDLRMFQGGDSFDHAESLLSPHMNYVPDAHWSSDMEIGTPSTTSGFPSDLRDSYHDTRHTSYPNHHLSLSSRHERVPSSTHSRESSYASVSPHQQYTKIPTLAVKAERPNIMRSITAPAAPNIVPQQRRDTVIAASTPFIKRSGSEDEDDEYIPSEDTKPRGRKRQRIPHTAVERRYRENLNAHLERLRWTVPSLAPKSAARGSKPGDGIGEGPKPSKCEVLNGAIEYISALSKRNSALEAEVEALRSQLGEI